MLTRLALTVLALGICATPARAACNKLICVHWDTVGGHFVCTERVENCPPPTYYTGEGQTHQTNPRFKLPPAIRNENTKGGMGTRQ